jgi:hypothetical protein
VVTQTKKPASTARDPEKVKVSGLELLAQYDAVLKSVKTLCATQAEAVKAEMREHFLSQVRQLKKRPPNYRGYEGDASASCELKKRATTSPFTPEEIELLNEYDIPVGENVVVEKQFRVNPEYANDPKKLAQIAKLLEKVPDLPDNLFEVFEVKTAVCTEETLDATFSDPKKANAVFDVVACLAVKPKLEHTNATTILRAVADKMEEADKCSSKSVRSSRAK